MLYALASRLSGQQNLEYLTLTMDMTATQNVQDQDIATMLSPLSMLNPLVELACHGAQHRIEQGLRVSLAQSAANLDIIEWLINIEERVREIQRLSNRAEVLNEIQLILKSNVEDERDPLQHNMVVDLWFFDFSLYLAKALDSKLSHTSMQQAVAFAKANLKQLGEEGRGSRN